MLERLTLGLVSTTYMKSLRGLDLTMASSICSSSTQRALKPERGWLLRQMAAWERGRKGKSDEEPCKRIYCCVHNPLWLQ